MQGLSWGVPVVTGDMSMGRGIVLAALCIPLSARRGALASSNGVLAHCVFMCRPSYLEQVRLSVRTQKNREDIAVPACGERGIVLAVLCIPLPLAGEALARVNCVLPHGVLCVPPVIS